MVPIGLRFCHDFVLWRATDMALSAGNILCSLILHRCALNCSYCSFSLSVPPAWYISSKASWDHFCQWHVHHADTSDFQQVYGSWENVWSPKTLVDLFFHRSQNHPESLVKICLDQVLHDNIIEGEIPHQLIFFHSFLSFSLHTEKLYNSTGRELRRALFSLKQIFQVIISLL